MAEAQCFAHVSNKLFLLVVWNTGGIVPHHNNMESTAEVDAKEATSLIVLLFNITGAGGGITAVTETCEDSLYYNKRDHYTVSAAT